MAFDQVTQKKGTEVQLNVAGGTFITGLIYFTLNVGHIV